MSNENSTLEASSMNESLVGPQLSRTPENNDMSSTPQSPYSANRSLIHDLTLASNPNFDIPPSPPGSPPSGMDKKFEHFLELKKQGVHFNEKLARSSALKNPSLLHKLMDFAGVNEHDQYATTLPRDLWDPSGFPAWAYKEELLKSQQDISKQREVKSRLHRENIEFVSGTTSGQSNKGGTPASDMGVKAPRGSAAERVMAGLDRERTRSPMVDASTARLDLERRGGRHEGPQSQPNTKKRSRSR